MLHQGVNFYPPVLVFDILSGYFPVAIDVRIGIILHILVNITEVFFFYGSWLTGTRVVTATPTNQCPEVKLSLVDLM